MSEYYVFNLFLELFCELLLFCNAEFLIGLSIRSQCFFKGWDIYVSLKIIETFLSDDPEIILLVLADMPSKKNDNYYGSRVAVPTAKDIFVEVLPKLGISPEYSEEELKNLDVKVPLLEGHIDDAKATLDNLGLKYEVIGNGIEVVSQSPLTGSMVSKDGCVYLYTEKRSDLVKYVEVPSFEFMDLENANLQASWSGLNIVTSGVSPTRPGAYVSGQKIEVGTRVVQGTVIELEFSMSESSYTAFAD